MSEKRPNFHQRKPLEKSVEKALRLYAKKMGIIYYKFTSPGRRGVPDRILVGYGVVMFLELKRPGKRPSDLQFNEISKIRIHGVYATWTDSVQEGKWLMDAMRAGVL